MPLAASGLPPHRFATVILPVSEHVFALCNPGSENALKLEARTAVPDWRPGYQRRGFVTFKTSPAATEVDLAADLACARRLCVSLGKSTDLATAVQRLGAVDHVHHARFANRAMQGLATDASPKTGDWIGTVVELAADEFWSGIHRHTPFTSPDPAGDPALEMPADSPSRAWLKLEQAIRLFDLHFTPADVVVELGCAPGGVALALLRRGVSVIGVDPAAMAAPILAHAIPQRLDPPPHRPWFYHCRKPAALVGKRDLGRDTTWFMSDMNQSPDVVLTECARFCRMAPTIRGVLITLKLTDLTQVAAKAAWCAALAALGFKTVRVRQLAIHHRELVLLGLR